MTEYLDILKKCSIFSGIEPDEIIRTLNCAGAYKRNYIAGEAIIFQHEPSKNVCILLSGSATSQKVDVYGKQMVSSTLHTGSVFGDVLAASRGHLSPVSVVSTEQSFVLYIPYESIFTRCNESCASHNLLLKNLVAAISEKYFELHERIDCLLRSSLKDKVLNYLLSFNTKKGQSFNIPHNREGLAIYLNADRSALSRELGRLRREGIIDYYKNTFRILK